MQRGSLEQRSDSPFLPLFLTNTSSTPHPNILDHVFCLLYKPSSIIFIIFCILNIFFLLPLCVFILRHCFQQTLPISPASSAAAPARHSDCFTHHVAILELIGVFGCFLCVSGVYCNSLNIIAMGFSFYSFTCAGETFFHLLMCLEHYLAVVHPITYMGLRTERGIKIRNICIFCTWLLCFTVGGLMQITSVVAGISFLLSIIAMFINSFCCFSVLRVLIHPGQGKQAGVKNGREQFKYRAFYTILAIMGALVVRFTVGVFWVLLSFIKGANNCLMLTFYCGFNIPSSLVLPLLFLHRARRGVCCRIDNKLRYKQKS